MPKKPRKGCVICMYKIAVMGDRESICGFAALGLSVFPTEDAKEAEKIIFKLSEQGFGVIYITEELAEKLEAAWDKLRSRSLPSVILIPGVKNNTGKGMRDVHRAVEKAVGSDILTN